MQSLPSLSMSGGSAKLTSESPVALSCDKLTVLVCILGTAKGGNLYSKPTCKRGTEPSALRNMYFTSSGLESNSSSKSSKNVVNGPVRVHITRAHTVLPSRLLMRKKTNVAVTCRDNVLDCGHWMILILELS